MCDVQCVRHMVADDDCVTVDDCGAIVVASCDAKHVINVVVYDVCVVVVANIIVDMLLLLLLLLISPMWCVILW